MNKRNSEMVRLLRADFVHHDDPVIVDTSIANVSNPPTDAQLDSTFGSPADLPDGFTAAIDDNGAGTVAWGVMALNGAWWYWSLTKAV